ncbi:MAG: hypothetical protein EHM55_08625 [Acidobacteria bacterium]|nr:MAG: hypothetical protein EHM55_08625 [Acidobacteriota bacterium]
MTRFALLILLALVAASARVHVQSSSIDPSGAYRCDGVSPDGQKYRAAVHIVKNGETYIVQWLTPRGVASIGVGVVNGNTFSVGYVGTTAGVVVYTLKDNKELSGEWTDLEASGQIFKETLTKLAEGEKIVMPRGGGPVF